MENKQGSGARAGSLGGKGFYIVLLLCAAVIGISAWIMLTNAGTIVEDETAEDAVDISGAYVTMLPAGTVPEPEDVDVMAEADPMAGTEPMTEDESMDAGETEKEDGGAAAETTAGTLTEPTAEPAAQSTMSDGTVSYVWPVKGDVQRPYSIQTLMYDSTMADWRTHDGVDVACDQGTPVLAAAGGLVVDVHNDDLLGTVVEIDHENGVHSVYANLAAQPPVAAGDRVTMGQTIGSVGGTALGEVNQVSHLHFAMKQDGVSADPTAYLTSDWTE